MTHGHAAKAALSHFSDKILTGYHPCLEAFTAPSNRGTISVDVPQALARDVAERVGLFSMEQALEPHRLTSRSGIVEGQGDELDPAGEEALDVEHVKTLVEPVDQESGGINAMGPDDARLTLFDRGRVHREGEDAQGRLRECILDRGAGAAHASAGSRLEVGEAAGQGPPPPRSPYRA